ncbi:unnamed protein product, partial [Musa textilis]
ARRYYRSRLGGSTAQHTVARRCYRLAHSALLNGPCSRPKRPSKGPVGPYLG